MIRGIECEDMAPFGKFTVNFPANNSEYAEVHLFTGINGTGKTRLLALIASLLGNDKALKFREKNPVIANFTGQIARYAISSNPNLEIGSSLDKFVEDLPHGHGPDPVSSIPIPLQAIENMVFGPTIAYGAEVYLSDSEVAAVGTVEPYHVENALRFSKVSGDSRNILQAIVNMKIQSALNMQNTGNEGEMGLLVKRLEAIVSEITGESFSFHVTTHPQASIKVKWRNSIIGFNSLPDGLRVILGWLAHAIVTTDKFWQGEKDPTAQKAIFLFDEIETHLHPAWQRKILPAFQKLFPKAQIFVATHSPFVISSLNEGWIYKLEKNESGTVTISQPIAASKGDSYITAVEDILGVNEWYDPETEKLLAEFRAMKAELGNGDESKRREIIKLAENIASRSRELEVMMGAELSQLKKVTKVC